MQHLKIIIIKNQPKKKTQKLMRGPAGESFAGTKEEKKVYLSLIMYNEM